MADLTYLIKIEGTDITKLTDFEVGENKLWKNAGRTMAGKLKATLIGNFPKIELSFTYLNRDEISLIRGLLKPAQITVNYWDATTKTYKEGEYYASDYSVGIYEKDRELYKPFKVSLVPYEKET